MEVNILLIGIIIAAVLGLYFGGKFLVSYIKDKKELKELLVDLDVVLEKLKDIALTIGDDEQDEVTVKMYSILNSTLQYALFLVDEEKEVTIDKLYSYVINLAEELGFVIDEKENKLIIMALEIIEEFIYEE